MPRIIKAIVVYMCAALQLNLIGMQNLAAADDDVSNLEKTYDIVASEAVLISGIDDLTIQVGQDPSLVITERRDRLDKVSVESSETLLRIDAKGESWFSRRDYAAILTLPSLSDLEISGSFAAEIEGVSADTLILQIAGSGDMIISGRCGRLDLESTGAVNIDASKLVCRDVAIDAAGAANMHVFASGSVDVEGAGGTDVIYSGKPDKILSDVAGVGSVSEAEETDDKTTL
ncbi:MAG: GIN domain-containing protein [Sphingomonadales bacterium]